MYFLSFGPNCHAAGILKMLGLREYSLPFDWAQSGSIQHNELLDMSAEAFYYRHIHSPSRLMTYERIGTPDKNGHTEGRLIDKDLIYGYRAFFNPHRREGTERGYFIRCINRAQKILLEQVNHIIILLAEHISNEEAPHLIPCPETAVHYIRENLKARAKIEVLVMKTYVYADLKLSFRVRQISPIGKVLEIHLPSSLDMFNGSQIEQKLLTLIYKKAIKEAMGSSYVDGCKL